jgi:hypothetical protein
MAIYQKESIGIHKVIGLLLLFCFSAQSAIIDIPVKRIKRETTKSVEETKVGSHNGIQNLFQYQASSFLYDSRPSQLSAHSLQCKQILWLVTTEILEDPNAKYYEKELTNYFNVQYYGTMYLGSHMKPMTFIFDTGSSVWMRMCNHYVVVLDSNNWMC